MAARVTNLKKLFWNASFTKKLDLLVLIKSISIFIKPVLLNSAILSVSKQKKYKITNKWGKKKAFPLWELKNKINHSEAKIKSSPVQCSCYQSENLLSKMTRRTLPRGIILLRTVETASGGKKHSSSTIRKGIGTISKSAHSVH